MIDKRTVKQRFERHAHEYDQYADVQRIMIDRLLAQPLLHNYVNSLHIEQGPAHIPQVLDIGCGTGLLAQALLERIERASFTLLDLSTQMLESAAGKLMAAGNVETEPVLIEADAEQWLTEQMLIASSRAYHPNRYSIILSSAALQWFEAPDVAVSRLVSILEEGGVIAFATLLPGTLQELHDACAAADTAMNKPIAVRGQTYFSASQWQACLSSLRGDIQYTWHEEPIVMKYPDVKQLLRHVRRIGAANAMQGRENAVSRSWLAAMEQAYRSHCEEHDEAIVATYQAGYGVIQLSNGVQTRVESK